MNISDFLILAQAAAPAAPQQNLLVSMMPLVFIFIIFYFLYAQNRVAPIVIKTWTASGSPNSDGHYVSIQGRREGLISWLLTRLGIDVTTSIKISAARIDFEQVSLSGRINRLIPLTSVCSTIYGYTKPWKIALLIFVLVSLAVVFGWASLTQHSPSIGSVFLGLVIGAGLAVTYYLFNRQFTLGFVEDSGVLSAIQFKRSVLENQDINEVQASYVSQVTQALIESARS